MKLRNSLLLLLTATIWGTAFVAQERRYGICRSADLRLHAKHHRQHRASARDCGAAPGRPAAGLGVAGGAAKGTKDPAARRRVLGTVLCIASTTQQITLLYTSVGKAGFMTACYILVVPVLGLLFGRRCGLKHWCSVAIALVGLYFLCMAGGSFGFDTGTLLGLGCALLFSMHILVIDHFSPMVDGVQMSCIQFAVCAVISGVAMLIFEQPTMANILAAWKAIMYAGVMSSGVAYTLQIVGQKGMNPTIASLIMSLESVISVIAGWLILGQALTAREIFGCALMFGAIVLAQLPEKAKAKA